MLSPWSTLTREWRALARPGPRMLDEAACVASVLLAIVLGHWIGAHMVSWSAFTAFVLMKGDITVTLLRGVLRIVGTMAGAGLALLVVPRVADNLPATVVCAALVGTVGLYGTLTARRAYAWLLFGLTFEMVLLDRVEHPAFDTWGFAHTRLLEVIAGTCACVAVSLVSTAIARRHWPSTPAPPASAIGWHPHAARHAVQAGIAVGLLPLLHALFAMPNLAQAGVTIMAVMIVPVAGLGASGLAPVSRRLFQRAAGCLAGGLLAAVVLLLAGGQAPILLAGTAIGIVIGRHIETGPAATAYLGLQFTLAILVTLVPDSYADAALRPAILRLSSVFIGMALLGPVLLVWHVFASGPRGSEGQEAGSLSE